MLSGDSARDNVLSTQAQGAAGFVCKPFSKEKIFEYVRQCPLMQPAADNVPGAARIRDHFKM
jgi:DNA-binding NarL/FixJ family response regulator